MDNKKVSDHHAIIPTAELKNCQAEELAKGEQDILSLIAARLLMAIAQKQVYTEAELVVLCVGERFAAKWKAVREHGWRAVEAAFLQLQGLKNRGNAETGMPCSIAEGAVIEHVSADMTEHFTSPRSHTVRTRSCCQPWRLPGIKNLMGIQRRKGLAPRPQGRASSRNWYLPVMSSERAA